MKCLFDLRLRKAPIKRRRRIDLGTAQPQYPIYAIGDIHGCLDLLIQAEERISRDMVKNQHRGPIILLGDYVDRGPRSAQVIDYLRKPSTKGLRRILLCGNHDDEFSSLLEQPDKIHQWIMLGGKETLMSYGIDVEQLLARRQAKSAELVSLIEDAIPEEDFTFLKSLAVSIRIGRYLFVHAGIRPGLEMDEQDDEDLMWIREPFLSKGPCLDLIVVHGHTPTKTLSIGPQRIGIDTQAYATGDLTVLKICDGATTII